jgi:hypothetical protein
MASKMVVASETAPKDGMATGTKVAIGAAAVGGVAGLVGLGIWLWKRRQAAAAVDGTNVSSARGGGGGGSASTNRSGGTGTETMTSIAQCPPDTRDDGQRCVTRKEDEDFERAWPGDINELFRTGGYTTPIMGDRGDAASNYTKDLDRTGKAGRDQHGADTGNFGPIASGPDSELADQHRRLWNF